MNIRFMVELSWVYKFLRNLFRLEHQCPGVAGVGGLVEVSVECYLAEAGLVQ